MVTGAVVNEFTQPVAASVAVIVHVCVTGALVTFVTSVEPVNVLITGVLFQVYE
jgi:hypothetical protein